ncbi:MAG: response regulator, partial [Chloroflexi bacterium]|nr:response regulator [Chloroflexota bacterium]
MGATAISPKSPKLASAQTSKILVVDDEEIIRVLLTEILIEDGYEVTTAANGEEAVQFLKSSRFDLLISDMVMPGMNGIEVLQAAFQTNSHQATIMITGYPSVETAVRLVNLGAADYITKPFNV